MRRSILFALILNLLGGVTLLADSPAPATQGAKDQTTIMTYDVSDLLRSMADYPLGTSSLPAIGGIGPGGGGGGGGGQSNGPVFGVPPGPSESSVTGDALIGLIKQMMPPSDITVSMLGNMLIVRAGDDAQGKIHGMLESMHQQQAAASSMVCVRVFWMSLNPAEVSSIFSKVKAVKDTNIAPMPELPDAMVDATHLYCQAQTICFSGQIVHVVSGRSQSYVSDVSPVVAQNAVGYQPTIGNAMSGVTVQLKPQLVSADSAVVDLASMVIESGEPQRQLNLTGFGDPTTQPGSSVHAGPAVQAVNVVQQEFHTTVRLPLGKKILVGGMTLEPAAKDQAGRQLFLIMQVDAVQ